MKAMLVDDLNENVYNINTYIKNSRLQKEIHNEQKH